MAEMSEKIAKDCMNCLRDTAKAKGLTMEVLADMTGITRQHIGRLWSGKHLPKLDAYIKLCDAVGMPFQNPCK